MASFSTPGSSRSTSRGRFPDGRLFIAMKLVRGRTLAALLATRRGPDEDRMRFSQSLSRSVKQWPTPMLGA